VGYAFQCKPNACAPFFEKNGHIQDVKAIRNKIICTSTVTCEQLDAANALCEAAVKKGNINRRHGMNFIFCIRYGGKP
jgi:hypothetical protein